MVSLWTCSLVPTALKATSSAKPKQIKTYTTRSCCLLCQGARKMHQRLPMLPIPQPGSKETSRQRSSAWDSWSLQEPGQDVGTEHQRCLCVVFPPSWRARACPTNSSIEACFPRDTLTCACWCSALVSNKLQACVKVSPQRNDSRQLVPTWISIPSRLRMLLFPSPLREGTGSLHVPPAARRSPQHFETFHPWRVEDLCLNISPCLPPLEPEYRAVWESSSNPSTHIQTLNI